MTLLDKQLIDAKLMKLDEYQRELDELFRSSIADIKRESTKRHTAERLTQLIVDAMIDINIHLIRQGDLPPSDDLKGTFVTLGEHGVLDKAFAEKLAPVVGIRNILVHQYEDIDLDLFLQTLARERGDFPRYAQTIKAYVNERACG